MPTKLSSARLPIPAAMVERRIHAIREQNVMLDSDLADLYQVETFNLNKAVQRNLRRFPDDFMFQLSKVEWDGLIFQTGISKSSRGGRRHAPYVFTEQGVAMLSSVLNSERAVRVNIAIMRAFVRIREIAGTHKDLLRKVTQMEAKYDDQFSVVFSAIKKLMSPPISKKRRIGFAAGGGA